MTKILITIVAEMDTGYLHAVGSTVDGSAFLFIRDVARTAFHEDFGSMLEHVQVMGVLSVDNQSKFLMNTDRAGWEKDQPAKPIVLSRQKPRKRKK